MKDKENIQENLIEDPAIVALCKLKGLQINPLYREGRITFHIIGDIEKVLQEIAENQKVAINDYLQALRLIRSTIFNLKKIYRGRED